MIEMIYPEKRKATEKEILSYAYDLWAGEADYHVCHECGENVLNLECEHTSEWEPIYRDGTPPPGTVEEAIELLEDRGVATFKRAS